MKPVVPDYELLRRIGTGSYGDVWLARSRATGIFRAAKVVWAHKFEEERPFQREFEGIQRFERICRGHASQLALFHIGRNELEGYFYYVMELADGLGDPGLPDKSENKTQELEDGRREKLDERPSDSYVPHTLRAELKQGRLSAERVLELGLTLTEALGHLHREGLVHRDVKPSNVIFVSGRPKLADIGLVSDVSDTRSIVGTEGFIPPEGSGTPQADIFALGKVLYEAATGLDRKDFPRLPENLRHWPDAPLILELNEILVKAAATAPQERYQSADAMNGDLLLLKSGQSVKRLRTVERRLAFLSRASVLVALAAAVGMAVLYEMNRQRQAVTQTLVRLQVHNGTQLLNSGDLFGSLLSFAEALRLDAGNREREENHRIRIASVLRECPKLAGVFTHKEAAINAAALSPDGRRVVTAGQDHTAKVWDVPLGRLQFVLQHTQMVFSASFRFDGGLIATSSADNLVHLWDAANGSNLDRARIRHRGHMSGPGPLFSPDGARLLTLLPGNPANELQLYEVGTGQPIGSSLRHEHEIQTFSYSPDGTHILSLSSDHVVRVWDGFTGEPFARFGHDEGVTCAAFSPDGQWIATGGGDGCVRFWDLKTKRLLAPVVQLRRAVEALNFDPQGRRLATVCRDRTVELWDVATRQPILRPLQHETKVFRADFSPDGRWLATSSEGNRVRLWETATGQLLAPSFIHYTPHGPALFSADGRLLLTLRRDLTVQREEVVTLWDLGAPGTERLAIQPNASFRQTATSRGGHYKAVIRGDRIDAVETTSGKPMCQALRQSVPFRQASFSMDNAFLITESVGALGQIWDLAYGEPLTPLLKVRYQLDTHGFSLKQLPHDPRPVADLVAFAELLSGYRVDETGGFVTVDRETLIAHMEHLRSTYPENFTNSTAQILAWHEEQARASEQAWNWEAAVFHINWFLAASPSNQEARARLVYALDAARNARQKAVGYLAQQRVIPPRDRSLSRRLIDLSEYYTRSVRGTESSFSALPSGQQALADTPFDIRGVVQFHETNRDASLTARSPAMRLDLRCRRLHFLHAATGQADDKTRLGSYLFRFADGGTTNLFLEYGSDFRAWETATGESLLAQKAALAWIGSNPDPQANSTGCFRLFKTTWENPRPDAEVASVEYRPENPQVFPFLVALTAE